MTSLSFFGVILLFLTVLSQNLTCQDPPLNSYPYCNPNLSISERVNDLQIIQNNFKICLKCHN